MATPKDPMSQDELIELQVLLGRLVDHAMCEGERYTKEGRVLMLEWAHRRNTLIREHGPEILGMLRRGGFEVLGLRPTPETPEKPEGS